ncbi:quinol oxidase subunit 2 [Lentibacillus kapialis]|uniref:Quinol oxidase subunit 2 n=1 Tax=Lentibacillus kapialis TaxID=340214 RepID=A0A917PRJ3_9BACI|nr:cytochrome aa3 quinol oxidase subunit II [Lentibacillus kapialis]GGJ88492.1 quinol oxidase subunit 2 [Lentibacillus kapialis]
MKHIRKYSKKWILLLSIPLILMLSGCSELTVMDPKGPVGEQQKDLIIYSLYFMMGIIVVVFVLFTFMVIKYRDKPGRDPKDYKPDMHGNKTIETIWTIIPVIIVTCLSIPTVNTLFDLEKPAESSAEEEPLVIYATAADWKWFFSYPEQGIETVDYLHIPKDRSVEFRLSSADSMSALWIPALGGQKYNMAGMQTTLYLQADENGVYQGRNSNFNGEGFAEQTFKVHAESKSEFNEWVKQTQHSAPKLTQSKYNNLLEPGILDDTKEFSSTHLQWVDHGSMEGSDYAVKRHWDAYGKKLHLKNGKNHNHE